MILVSTPGTWSAVYQPLDHAAWNGWTPTDLVFPFLLFAMGAAVPLALARRKDAHRGRYPVHRHVLRRALLLFALGLLLNAIETPPPLRLATFRIPGVLQRIALVYVAVAAVTETLPLEGQVTAAAGALLAYWAALTLVPVPGAGAGALTPAGNLASFVDRALLGRHLLTPDFDPEGLLSTIPSVATALMGVFAGVWLSAPRGRRGWLWLWAAGAAATVAGLAWGRVFPINKNLWTSSFAVFSGGIAAQVLALCHWIVDEPRPAWHRWLSTLSGPFSAFGRNALAAYFLSVGLDSLLTRWNAGNGLSLKAVLYRNGFASWLRPCCGSEAASLAYALAYVALWAIVFAELHRRRLFISI